MKILRVISSMNPENGGPSQGIRNSIPQMSALGVTTNVVCLDSPDAAYIAEKKDPFGLFAIGEGKGPWNYNAALGEWLLNNAAGYDAIIVHGLWLYHGYAVYKAMKKLKKQNSNLKWFVMPHGMLDPYFQKAESRRLKAMRNWLYWKLIEGPIVNSADGVLFTCEEELRLARETFTPYRPKREINVGYGIQPPPVYTDETGRDFFNKFPALEGKKYFLFLSRIHEKKGVDLLLQAYADFVKKTPDAETLVIAGPGTDTPYGKKLQEFVEGQNLAEKVVFTGMLTGNLKWGAIYNAEVFVLPSHQENFGIAIVEAMACKKPVLITDKVNIWREIKDADGGFVENDDFAGTLKLITQWQQLTAEQKTAKSNNAYTAYKTYFSIEQAALKLKEGIERVVRQ